MPAYTGNIQQYLAQRGRQQLQLQQQQHAPTPPEDTVPPPPYEEEDMDSDSSSSASEEPEPMQPVKLTINAAHSIQGCNNLVPTSPNPLADATKFSTLLMHAVKQINTANAGGNTVAQPKSCRVINVDLTINCGITIIGDRNVIGNVGLKPKEPLHLHPPGSAQFTQLRPAAAVANQAAARPAAGVGGLVLPVAANFVLAQPTAGVAGGRPADAVVNSVAAHPATAAAGARPATATTPAATIVGAKRKAEEQPASDEGATAPAAKKTSGGQGQVKQEE